MDEAADLSIKSNNVNDKRFSSKITSSTIDLSMRRESAADSTCEGTLDLSIPSSASSLQLTENNANVQPSNVSRRSHRHMTRPQPFRPIRMIDNWSKDLASPDIVMSDDEPTNGQINGHANDDDSDSKDDSIINYDELPFPPSPKLKQLSSEDLVLRQKRLKRLKQELRNEEMKLVLLKKIRQSQLMKENIVNDIGVNAAIPNVPLVHSAAKLSASALPLSRNSTNVPVVPSAHMRSQNRNHSVLNPPIARHHQSLSHGHIPIGPPTIGLNSHRSNSNSAHNNNTMLGRPAMLGSMLGSRTPVTTPPNVVLGYPLQELRAQTQSNSHGSNNQLGLPSGGSPGPSSTEMAQTPAQRQAAAKLALRKQLEKTLLQIPPPKPPPPEMHFIPNANNQEFIYYLGLETVVDFLTDSPNQNRPPPDPFECVQCGADFTPVWKWQDRMDPNRDRPAVICENCVTSNIKKALKAEHTNRLKTAFVKALQQEQEIEQRIASGASSPPLPSVSPPPQQTNYSTVHHQSSPSLVTSVQSLLPQAPPAHSSLPRLSSSANAAAAAAAAVASSAALLQQIPKLSAAHQSLFAAQAQQLHQLAHSLPQPQPAHMLPFAPLLAAQAYSYSMLGKSGSVSSSDLHRQYLLDMIPPRSLPQGSFNWKT